MQSVFLGSDRRYNRYWLFLGPCNAYDQGFFLSSEDGHWEVIDTGEALCALLSVLDDRGKREALLIANDSLPSSGVVALEVRKKGEQQKQKWSRIQAFDSWLWNSFYLDLNAVKHETYAIHVATCKEKEASDTFPKHKVLSSQIQSLKAAMHAIESVMPEDALLGAWKKSAHKLWVKRLRRSSSLAEFLQVLGDFVGAINEDRFYECNRVQGSCNFSEELIASFACMPQTASAVALWLVRLDALIAPYLERAHSQKRLEISVRLRGKHAPKQYSTAFFR
ncbi:hypothetical protein Pyn_21136 [Prunus yedoensis var. nudiflora]|nr:hypothetical protein Pyn_21136 [Prunus yedoensis var. nudiflora]